MKIIFLKKYGCYFVKTYKNNAFLLNFNTNRVIQVSLDFNKTLNSISSAYVNILSEENVIALSKTNFFFDKIYKPTNATFLMTTKCNLNCIYCYAYNNCNQDLSFLSAKIAVDFLISNAIEKGRKKITIRFHGLGEPTQNFNVLKQIVEYAKKKCIKKSLSVIFHITSNGVMKEHQLHYILDNINFITLSIDGTKDYQNIQRPLLNGDSFAEAMNTLDEIKDKSNVLIRTTVTNFSLDNLEEWCEFLEKKGVKNINIEPVSICGNCKNNNITDLDNSFCRVFAELSDKFKNINITYSCFRNSKRPFHCGAYGDNMVVTPFNDISTCYECFDNSEPTQSLFIIGKINESSIFIDNDKLNLLKDISIKLRKECANCYAQTFCNGSCLSKRYKSFIEEGNSYSIVKNKCKITKKIIEDKLLNRLSSEISFTHSEKLFY